MNLVLTFHASLKANFNASTHTNYLISLLKNVSKKGPDPSFLYLSASPKTVRVSKKWGLTPFST